MVNCVSVFETAPDATVGFKFKENNKTGLQSKLIASPKGNIKVLMTENAGTSAC